LKLIREKGKGKREKGKGKREKEMVVNVLCIVECG
jgi:hypothetical protein